MHGIEDKRAEDAYFVLFAKRGRVFCEAKFIREFDGLVPRLLDAIELELFEEVASEFVAQASR